MAIPDRLRSGPQFRHGRSPITKLSERPMRSDARRNRERVLAAAGDVFADLGLKAQVEEVARRAGVGVGTVCRHFPTKQALVEAVLEAMYEALLADAEHALTLPDPGAAFEAFFVEARGLSGSPSRPRGADGQRDRPSHVRAADAPSPTSRDHPTRRQRTTRGHDPLRYRSRGRRDALLRRRPLGALAGDLEPMLRQRYLTIILDGLRPIEPSQLPGKPLDFAQLDRIKKRRAAQ